MKQKRKTQRASALRARKLSPKVIAVRLGIGEDQAAKLAKAAARYRTDAP